MSNTGKNEEEIDTSFLGWLVNRKCFSQMNALRFRRSIASRLSYQELMRYASESHRLKDGIAEELLKEIARRSQEKYNELD